MKIRIIKTSDGLYLVQKFVGSPWGWLSHWKTLSPNHAELGPYPWYPWDHRFVHLADAQQFVENLRKEAKPKPEEEVVAIYEF